MNTFQERLRYVIDNSGYSLRQFAREIGISPGGLSGILGGRTKEPSPMFLNLIEYRFGVTREWLLNGKGAVYTTKMMVEEGEETDLITGYRKLTREDKGTVKRIIESLERGEEEK